MIALALTMLLATTALDPATAHDLRDTLRSPSLFARRFLCDRPWARQRDIMDAVARPHARVAVKACHASGKTHCAAEVALWFLTRFPDGIVVTTAPTWPQVELLLWGEIHAALGRARIAYPEPNKTGLEIRRDNYAIGLSTNEGVRFQGFHAPHLLFILDEAPGVRPDIWEAIEGARAGGDVRVLALGNPTIASGPFYDAFGRDRAQWHTITISAFDTPNLAGITLDEIQGIPAGAHDDPRLAYAPRPYLTTRRWVHEKWHTWGRHGHPLWDARVLGAFPAQTADALIALSWIEVARTATLAPCADGIRAGIDVAGPGEDETTLWVRQGPNILASAAWPSDDPRGEIVQALAPYRDQLEAVNVDSAGIGYYLATHLRDLGFPVRFVNVGEKPRDAEQFRNLKAELYWGLRMRFEEGAVCGPIDDETTSQLAGIRWTPNSRGQTEIESKEDARKRGVKSPDRAEGLMLAFADAGGSGLLDWMREQVTTRRNDAAEKGERLWG